MSSEESFPPKLEGDTAFRAGHFAEATELYTKALEQDPKNHLLYSNRSAAYASLGQYAEALADGEMCIKLRPDWVKGYTRKALALFYQGNLMEALDCYGQGLDIDPENLHVKESLTFVSTQLEEINHPFSELLQDANLVKLMTHPRTSSFFQSPEFISMINAIKHNPNTIAIYMKEPKLMEVVSVLLGSDISAEQDKGVIHPPDPRRTAAVAEKELGNAAYKHKQFDFALEHYEAAHSLDPQDITYLNNMSAVFFEQKDYVRCVETCEEAVTQGRENGADAQKLSRALTRQGDAYIKLGMLDAGMALLNKSLLEQQSEAVKDRIRKLKKMMEKADGEAKIVKEAGEANKEANALFLRRKFTQAIDLYSKAISLSPTEAKYWFNRSACHLKLKDYMEALHDIDTCISFDQKNTKWLFRKGLILCQMGEVEKAQQVLDEAGQYCKTKEEAEEMKAQLMALAEKRSGKTPLTARG